MTEISERYRRLSESFGARIAAVPADQWVNASPCEGWSARDLVRHVVETQGTFLGFIGEDMPELPSVESDPLKAWTTASSEVQERLEDPAKLKAEFQGFSGPSSFEAAVNRFLCFDLVVHTWDLAKATGQAHHMEPEDIERVRAQAEEFGPAMRGPQAFGPELPPPPDADAQQRLLAYLGRRG